MLSLIRIKMIWPVLNYECMELRFLNSYNINIVSACTINTCAATMYPVGLMSSSESQFCCGVPQGSVLFSVYTAQIGSIIDHHAVSRKIFADDTELYKVMKRDPESSKETIACVQACCQEIKHWMSTNKLKLNDEKTEAILCGSKSNVEKSVVKSVIVGDAEITFSNSVRNLGLIMDNQLSIKNMSVQW